MKTAVQPLEGNKVKLSVEVEEQEFEEALDAAFRKMAREVRIPGFRPGKAPRRLLEARIGRDAAREAALRDSLPDYYARALQEADLDAIAPPDIDITAGASEGPVRFDAVVEVRPQIQLVGYGGLRVTLPRIEPTDQDVDAQLDRLRAQFAELVPVNRPARDGDHVTIDVHTERGGTPEPGLTADDYLYEVGSGSMFPEVDQNLRGARVGDILQFSAPVPGDESGQRLGFRILVKDVKEKVLPEATDEWAADASEFETLAELREELRKRLRTVARARAQLALQDEAMRALVELVDDEPPESLVAAEVERRLEDLSHRLGHEKVTLEQYMEATGSTREAIAAELREDAVRAVKADLALRALADAEGIVVTEADIEAQMARLAEQFKRTPGDVRRQLERADQMPAVRSDVRKAKALEWLSEHVEMVDEDGRPIDRAELLTEPEPAAGHSDQSKEGESEP